MFCYLYRFHLNPSLNHVHTKLILKYLRNCENFTMNFYILINSIYIKSSKQLSFSVRWINLQQPNRPSQKFQIKKLTWHAMKKSPVNFMIFSYYIYFKLSYQWRKRLVFGERVFFLINISFKTPCIWLNFPLIVKGIYDPAVPDLSSSIIIEKSSSYIVTTNDIIYDTWHAYIHTTVFTCAYIHLFLFF